MKFSRETIERAGPDALAGVQAIARAHDQLPCDQAARMLSLAEESVRLMASPAAAHVKRLVLQAAKLTGPHDQERRAQAEQRWRGAFINLARRLGKYELAGWLQSAHEGMESKQWPT